MAKRPTETTEHLPSDCRRIGQTLARIGDKWTVLLLVVLGDKRLRFKELHRSIGGISQRMLTVTLRNLERDGLITRTVYATVPPKVEYELSDRGRELKKVIHPIAVWTMTHQDAIEESRKSFDKRADAAE